MVILSSIIGIRNIDKECRRERYVVVIREVRGRNLLRWHDHVAM